MVCLVQGRTIVDVLLQPVQLPVAGIPPDIGLLRHELASLRVRRRSRHKTGGSGTRTCACVSARSSETASLALLAAWISA